MSEHDFALRVVIGDEVLNSTVRIPYGLLRHAWPTVDRKAGLFLHARIVHRAGELAPEPF